MSVPKPVPIKAEPPPTPNASNSVSQPVSASTQALTSARPANMQLVDPMPAPPTPPSSALSKYSPPRLLGLSTGLPLSEINFVSKWRAATLYDAEYADCVIIIKGVSILTHRAVVLPQSEYLKDISSKVPDPNGLFTIDIDTLPVCIPDDQRLLVAQGVLHAMYGNKSDSIILYTYADNRIAGNMLRRTFFACVFMLAVHWKSYFAMEVILNDLCNYWLSLDVTTSDNATTVLCKGIDAMLTTLEAIPDDNTCDFPPIGIKYARDICLEFVLTHLAALNDKHLPALTTKFPWLQNSINAIFTRSSYKRNAKCKRCVDQGRRPKATAHVADIESSPCAICKALDGELGFCPRPGLQVAQPAVVRKARAAVPPASSKGKKRPAEGGKAAKAFAAKKAKTSKAPNAKSGKAGRKGVLTRLKKEDEDGDYVIELSDSDDDDYDDDKF